jgi:sodium transport system permease protein
MVTLGAFHPAIDATAGERERSTWETTLGLGVPRRAILIAKYLYVATAGAVAGLLNMSALGLSTASMLSGLMRDSTVQFSVSPWAAVTLALGTVVVALLVAAMMLVAGVFARSFKEGQGVLSPMLLVITLPMLLVTPHTVFTWKMACVPLVNVMLVFRDALQGVFHLDLVGLSLVVSLGAVGAALWLALWILQFEEVASGSYAGHLGTLLREKLSR